LPFGWEVRAAKLVAWIISPVEIGLRKEALIPLSPFIG